MQRNKRSRTKQKTIDDSSEEVNRKKKRKKFCVKTIWIRRMKMNDICPLFVFFLKRGKKRKKERLYMRVRINMNMC